MRVSGLNSSVSCLAVVLALTLPVYGQTSGTTKALAAAGADLGSLSRSIEDLARQVGPAVVQIFSVSYALGDGSALGLSSAQISSSPMEMLVQNCILPIRSKGIRFGP